MAALPDGVAGDDDVGIRAGRLVKDLWEAGRLRRKYADVHIYFGDAIGVTREAAEAHLRALGAAVALLATFEANFTPPGPTWPHTLPMLEGHVHVSSVPAAVKLLQERGARALVHPHTASGYDDHVALATWVGPPLDLDLTVFK